VYGETSSSHEVANFTVHGLAYSFYPFSLDPSMIESRPVNQVIVEGSNVTLHCNATGNPTPDITWTKDGSSTVLYQGETYSIVNVQRQAAGEYACTAWNGVGERKNVSATVTVHCKLYFSCSSTPLSRTGKGKQKLFEIKGIQDMQQ